MPPHRLWIEPLPGYSPAIGRLACILTCARERTLADVDGLTTDALDHRHDAQANSIGALLAHMAATERVYQLLTFEDRGLSPEEEATWTRALDLGAPTPGDGRGVPLSHYLDEMATLRRATLSSLRQRDDAWLERALPAAPELNAHWAWFHVAEDEASHRGQIRWLKRRLPRHMSDHADQHPDTF